MKESEINETYQEFSVKCGERAERLAWAFIIMLVGCLISGHAFQTFAVCAMLSVISLLLVFTKVVPYKQTKYSISHN